MKASFYRLCLMALCLVGGGGAWDAKAGPDGDTAVLLLGRRDVSVHDPSTIARCKNESWVFATGLGIHSCHSADLIHWVPGPPVFTNTLSWTTNAVPGNRGRYWAPDVIHLGHRYFLYFAVSTWGKNTSAIGLATNPTLDPADPDFAWVDQGPVLQTSKADNFNAIDPAVILDGDGRLWLALGSFWSGINSWNWMPPPANAWPAPPPFTPWRATT